uniref:Protein kinase domain-containing protein n=1 Tax=Panagrolaimus davidi TaxID=227884 RepID=A0A914Q6N1_9BILA
MVPKNPENALSGNSCHRLKQYGITPHSNSFNPPVGVLVIGVGIIIVLIIVNTVCRIFKKNPISAFMETYEFKNKEELSKECNKLQLGKKDFKINFNVVKGRGAFSTVYKAELKRSLIPNLSQKYMTNDNNTSEYCIVAAKILSNYEKEEMFNVIGEIQAVQKLGSHEKICTLLRWSTHSGAPCLFFELMEMDLQSYLISLRNKSNNLLTKDELVLSLTDIGDAFDVPEFDRKQQLIFMQILWQISQGLEYIASNRIVHR